MRTVEVYRQQMNRVEAVLLAVRLPLHQQHLLRDAVRRVGLLRDSRSTDRARRTESARASDTRRSSRRRRTSPLPPPAPAPSSARPSSRSGRRTARRFAVRADAADDGGEVDDDVGLRLLKQPADVGLVRQIVLRLATTTTSPQPRLREPSTTWRPRKPLPPVTRTRWRRCSWPLQRRGGP